MGQTGLSAGQTLRPGSPVGCLRFSALSSPFVKGGQSGPSARPKEQSFLILYLYHGLTLQVQSEHAVIAWIIH